MSASAEPTTRCEVCTVSIVQVVEQHDTYWTSIEDGDSLSYVPELHDHRPSPESSAVAQKVSESTNRQKLEALSAEAADLATAMSQRGDTEGSFYARGLRDAYAIAAAFWSGPEVAS